MPPDNGSSTKIGIPPGTFLVLLLAILGLAVTWGQIMAHTNDHNIHLCYADLNQTYMPLSDANNRWKNADRLFESIDKHFAEQDARLLRMEEKIDRLRGVTP